MAGNVQRGGRRRGGARTRTGVLVSHAQGAQVPSVWPAIGMGGAPRESIQRVASRASRRRRRPGVHARRALRERSEKCQESDPGTSAVQKFRERSCVCIGLCRLKGMLPVGASHIR